MRGRLRAASGTRVDRVRSAGQTPAMARGDGDGGSARLGKGVDRRAFERARALMADPDADAAAVAEGLLRIAGRGRTAFRGVTAALERSPDRGGEGGTVAARVMGELADRAGVEPGSGARPGRLLRLAAGAEEPARSRRNPIARNEGFVCVHCGLRVLPADGGVQRNHCPACLCSLHVDEVPGDRAAGCGGVMRPVGLESAGADRAVIVHRCERCGAVRRVGAALRCTRQPDDPRALRALAARADGDP